MWFFVFWRGKERIRNAFCRTQLQLVSILSDVKQFWHIHHISTHSSPLNIIIIALHFASNPLPFVPDVAFGSVLFNLSAAVQSALPSAQRFPTTPCTDVRLSCVRARKSEISDEFEEEVQEAGWDYAERLFSSVTGCCKVTVIKQ